MNDRIPYFMFIFLFSLVFLSALHGQRRTATHHEKLRKIRADIQKVEKEIAASEKKASSELYLLTNLDLEIDLTQSFIQSLKKEQKKKEKQITKIEQNLKTTQEELNRLKDILKKRLVYFYKYGRMKDLELLLTARSINKGLLWLEYQKRMSQQDFRNYQKIKEKQAQITVDKNLLTIELAEKRKLLKTKIREEQNLKNKKAERQKILRKIQKDTAFLKQELQAKEKAAEDIQKLIAQLEAAAATERLIDPGTPFAELKGKMLWPVRGKVITRFGKYRHPELKTVTENLGIDIQAEMGTPIQAVASGKVTVITWQRGRGNLIIISHYGGFYSVYTHLEAILVDMFDEVTLGQIIGKVGESGSLRGPMLHFELWQGQQKLNPENWLSR
ncbi:MAG: murein hydrolase activator EnvC family protein [bacterium]